MCRRDGSSRRASYRLRAPVSSGAAALKSRPSVLLRRKRSEPASPRRPRRRIRKLRLLALVGVLAVLALKAFSFALVLAVSQQRIGLSHVKQRSRQQVYGYVYGGDGHT